MWWIIVWLGWGVGWYWFIGYGMMFFVIRLVLLWRLGYDHLQPSAVVWSCHAWRHQILNRWGYGSWNHWEKKEGSTNKLWEECVKRIRNNNAWEEGLCTFERNYRKKLEQKLLTPASKDNGIKTDVVVVAVILISRCISTYGKLLIFSLTIKNPVNWLV